MPPHRLRPGRASQLALQKKEIAMQSRKIMAIVWPAFLAACLLELLVFGFVDPQDVHLPGQLPGWSRQAVYTAAFFVFWGVCMASSALTALLVLPFAPPDKPPPR
jgi:hypothetical protein